MAVLYLPQALFNCSNPLFLCSTLWGGVATAEDITLKVGVYQNPPKVFIDDTGEAAGIFVDIIEAVAARERWDIEYVSGSWNRGLQRLRSGIIDLMPDVAHTLSRAGWF